jgi:hypothetical protein
MATLVEVVALNALSVSRWVMGGSTGSTLGCASRGRPVFIHVWPRSVYPCGWSLNSISLRRFSVHEFLGGLLLLIVGFGYP